MKLTSSRLYTFHTVLSSELPEVNFAVLTAYGRHRRVLPLLILPPSPIHSHPLLSARASSIATAYSRPFQAIYIYIYIQCALLSVPLSLSRARASTAVVPSQSILATYIYIGALSSVRRRVLAVSRAPFNEIFPRTQKKSYIGIRDRENVRDILRGPFARARVYRGTGSFCSPRFMCVVSSFFLLSLSI